MLGAHGVDGRPGRLPSLGCLVGGGGGMEEADQEDPFSSGELESFKVL